MRLLPTPKAKSGAALAHHIFGHQSQVLEAILAIHSGTELQGFGLADIFAREAADVLFEVDAQELEEAVQEQHRALMVDAPDEGLLLVQCAGDMLLPAHLAAAVLAAGDIHHRLLETHRTQRLLGTGRPALDHVPDGGEPHILAIEIAVDCFVLLPLILVQQEQHQILLNVNLIGDAAGQSLDIFEDVVGVQQLVVDLPVDLLFVGRVAGDQPHHRHTARAAVYPR